MPLATSHEVQPTAWLSWEPSDLSELGLDSPPGLLQNTTWRVFLGQFTYIVYCAFIVYSCLLTGFNSFPFIQSNIQFNCFCFNQLQFLNKIVRLFYYFSIIAQFLSILILEMYSEYFDPVKELTKSQQTLKQKRTCLLPFQHRFFKGLLPP
jgi:hypothetical protein